MRSAANKTRRDRVMKETLRGNVRSEPNNDIELQFVNTWPTTSDKPLFF
jgi:hypothetical protein